MALRQTLPTTAWCGGSNARNFERQSSARPARHQRKGETKHKMKNQYCAYAGSPSRLPHVTPSDRSFDNICGCTMRVEFTRMDLICSPTVHVMMCFATKPAEQLLPLVQAHLLGGQSTFGPCKTVPSCRALEKLPWQLTSGLDSRDSSNSTRSHSQPESV